MGIPKWEAVSWASTLFPSFLSCSIFENPCPVSTSCLSRSHPHPHLRAFPQTCWELFSAIFFFPAFFRQGKLTLIGLPHIPLGLPGWAQLWEHGGSSAHARLQVILLLLMCGSAQSASLGQSKLAEAHDAKAESPRLEEEASEDRRVSLSSPAQSSPGSRSLEDMSLGHCLARGFLSPWISEALHLSVCLCGPTSTI